MYFISEISRKLAIRIFLVSVVAGCGPQEHDVGDAVGVQTPACSPWPYKLVTCNGVRGLTVDEAVECFGVPCDTSSFDDASFTGELLFCLSGECSEVCTQTRRIHFESGCATWYAGTGT